MFGCFSHIVFCSTNNMSLALRILLCFQVIHLKYHYPHSELQNLALKAMEMLQGNASIDPHALVTKL